MDIRALLLPYFLAWALLLLLLLFRSECKWIWKTAVVCVFLFYALWFWPELQQTSRRYAQRFDLELLHFLRNIGRLLPFILLILWPIALYKAYVTASAAKVERILRNMLLLTLIYWLWWISDDYLRLWPRAWSLDILLQKLINFKLPSPPI